MKKLTSDEIIDLQLIADGFPAIKTNIATRIGVRFDRFLASNVEKKEPTVAKITIFSIDGGDVCFVVATSRFELRTCRYITYGYLANREAMYDFLRKFPRSEDNKYVICDNVVDVVSNELKLVLA